MVAAIQKTQRNRALPCVDSLVVPRNWPDCCVERSSPQNLRNWRLFYKLIHRKAADGSRGGKSIEQIQQPLRARGASIALDFRKIERQVMGQQGGVACGSSRAIPAHESSTTPADHGHGWPADRGSAG